MGKKVHIIGIAGQMSGPLAKELKEKGWEVTGADQEGAYPPLTTYLQKNKIRWFSGFSASHIRPDLDLVIVSGCALLKDKRNPELVAAQKYGLEIISQAEALARFLIKKNSVVISGSYGKTTTTAFLVSIFNQGGRKPSFMFGGIPVDFSDPLQITSSSWSIVEGDEYPTLHFDSRPKFFLYHPRFLLLTAVSWEHLDVYPTLEKYQKVFRKLIEMTRKNNGFVLANQRDKGVRKVIASFSGRKSFYSWKKERGADWWGENYSFDRRGVSFFLRGKRLKKPLLLKTSLLGRHNGENALAAAAMALELGIKEEAVKKGIAAFKGIKKRLEILGKFAGRTLIVDVSQTKPRIQAALKAVRDHFPGKIWVIFFPHYTSLLFKKGRKELEGSFSAADRVIITRIRFRREISKEDRISGKEMRAAIFPHPQEVFYLPLEEEVVEKVVKESQKGDVIIFMSSGGYRSLPKTIIRELERRKEE